MVEDIDAIEVFNPRVAFSAFNEEAARFAAKYRIVAGAGSDSHVAQGLGSVKIRMRDFDGPEEFLESLRDADIVRKRQSLLYVQALKFIQTKGPEGAQEMMHARGGAAGPSKASGQVPATDDEIKEKYLERAIRELNQLTRAIQSCDHCPRGNLMPVLGSGHPQADIMLLKFAPVPSEIEEGVAFYGRAGSALMKSFKRLGIDPLTVYGTVFVKCPVGDTDLSAPGVPRSRARRAGDRAAAHRRGDGRGGARGAERARRAARRASWRRDEGEIQRLTPACDALYVPDIDGSLDDERAKREFWGAFRSLGDWYEDFPPATEGGGALRSRLPSEREVSTWPRRPGSSSSPTAPRSRRSCSTRSRTRAVHGPCEFTLLVPATPHGIAWAADMHAGESEAEGHRKAFVEELRREGLDVRDAKVGDADPLAAVCDECNFTDYDELIVSTLPLKISKWLRVDLPRKAQGRHRPAGPARRGERGEGGAG